MSMYSIYSNYMRVFVLTNLFLPSLTAFSMELSKLEFFENITLTYGDMRIRMQTCLTGLSFLMQ
jgi:hypothetical protein